METSVTVHTDSRLGDCPRFWEAIGDDEAYDWTLQPAGEALLREIGRTRCVRWMRNHYVFSKPVVMSDGRRVYVYNRAADGTVTYDFSGIDAVYDRWLAAGVRPVVELDFLPEALRDDTKRPLNTPEMWREWRALLRVFLRHLQERYGVEETRNWYFENWNEPDLWPRERIDEFFRLHDEAVAAIEEVDPLLRLGGPGAMALPFCDLFMQHVTIGQNQVTGGRGSRCDFISLHQYGASGNTLLYYPAMFPRPQDVASRCYWLYETAKVHLGMREREFHLNEWGMISHYEKNAYGFPPLELRNTEYFALFMVKLIHLLFTLADRRGSWLPKMMLLWAGAEEAHWAADEATRTEHYGERSGLFAGNRSLTTAHDLVKPIFRCFELLTRLGETRLQTTGGEAGLEVGALAAHGGGAIQVLLYNFREGPATACESARVRLTLRGPQMQGAGRVWVTRLDRAAANSYRAWEAMGKPEHPTGEQIEYLRRASEIVPGEAMPVAAADGVLDCQVEVPGHGIALVEVSLDAGAIAGPSRQGVLQTPEWRIA